MVVPVHNEEDGIEAFHDRATRAIASIEPPVRLELLYVNDGSTDRSGAILRKLAERDEDCRLIKLSRHFGHQVAITSGIDAAAGDAVVVIDAGLQDPPEVIPELVARWRDGHKVVNGVPAGHHRQSLFNRLAGRLLDRISDTPLVADSGDFRLLDRQVVDGLKGIREEARYIRGLVSWIGFPQHSVTYERDRRFAGTSKPDVGRTVRFALAGIISFSEKPLRLALQLGAAITVLTLAFGSVIVIGKLLDPRSTPLPGYASLMTVILFFGGVQLITIGLLGQYVGRTYREAKRRPLYVVAERINIGSPGTGA